MSHCILNLRYAIQDNTLKPSLQGELLPSRLVLSNLTSLHLHLMCNPWERSDGKDVLERVMAKSPALLIGSLPREMASHAWI